MTDWPASSAILKRLRTVGKRTIPAPNTKARRLFDSYLASYPAYLSYFANRSTLCTDDLLVGAGMVYSWMPSALAIQPNLLGGSLSLLQVADSRKLGPEDLEQLRAFMGNSMVGASKLLHFITPTRYPIWDSRICRFLFHTTHQRLIQDTKGYLRYQELCEELINSQGYESLRKAAESICGYALAPMRTVELLMFMAGATDENERRGLE